MTRPHIARGNRNGCPPRPSSSAPPAATAPRVIAWSWPVSAAPKTLWRDDASARLGYAAEMIGPHRAVGCALAAALWWLSGAAHAGPSEPAARADEAFDFMNLLAR